MNVYVVYKIAAGRLRLAKSAWLS